MSFCVEYVEVSSCVSELVCEVALGDGGVTDWSLGVAGESCDVLCHDDVSVIPVDLSESVSTDAEDRVL